MCHGPTSVIWEPAASKNCAPSASALRNLRLILTLHPQGSSLISGAFRCELTRRSNTLALLRKSTPCCSREHRSNRAGIRWSKSGSTGGNNGGYSRIDCADGGVIWIFRRSGPVVDGRSGRSRGIPEAHLPDVLRVSRIVEGGVATIDRRPGTKSSDLPRV